MECEAHRTLPQILKNTFGRENSHMIQIAGSKAGFTEQYLFSTHMMDVIQQELDDSESKGEPNRSSAHF